MLGWERERRVTLANKKIAVMFAMFFLVTFMIASVSAVEFDNIGVYDEETKTATIINTIGVEDWNLILYELDDVATVDLIPDTTHLQVEAGKDVLITEWDVYCNEDYVDPFKNMESYDLNRGMERIEKDYIYRQYVKVGEEDKYERVCVPSKEINSTGGFKFDCDIQITGKQNVYEWQEISSSCKEGESIRLGLFGDVEDGEHIEIIPEWFGVRHPYWLDFVGYTKIEWYDIWTGDLGCTAPNVCGGIFTLGATGVLDSYDIIGLSVDYTSAGGWAVITNESGVANKPDFTQNLTVNTSIGSGTTGHNISLPLATLHKDGGKYAYVLQGGTAKRDNDGADAYPGGEAFYGTPGSVTVYNDWYIPFELYGSIHIGDLPPANSLNETPVDYANLTTPNVELVINGTDDIGALNNSLFINGVLNSTSYNTTALQLALNHSIELTFSQGSYNWSGMICDTNDACVMTANKTFTILSGVTATLSSPIDWLNTTDPTPDLSCNFTGVGVENVDDVTIVVKDSGGNTDYTNTENGIGSQSYNKTWTTSTLTDDTYNWSCDVLGDLGGIANTINRTISIDTIDPLIAVIYPLENITSSTATYNVTFNTTVSDLNLQACWTFDGTLNVSKNCGDNLSIVFPVGTYTLIDYANDTHGNMHSNSTTFSYAQYTSSYLESADPIAEGGSVTFELYVNLTNIPTTVANLTINNTVYGGTATAYQNYTYFTTTVAIPVGWGNTTGLLQDWNWNFNIESVAEVTLQTENITVFSMGVDNCSIHGTEILSLNLYDEETTEYVNVTSGTNMEIDLYLTNPINTSIIFHYFNTWADQNNVSVCVPNGILNTTNYTIDFTIGFDTGDHVWEFYHLDNGTLDINNDLLSDLTNKTIYLMDLLTVDSTSFLFNFFDLDGLPIENTIIHVFRRYIGEGDFREVERSKEDENGDTIVHLVEEDVIYYFVVSLEAQTLYLSSQYTALCQSLPCAIQLQEGGGFQEFTNDWDLIEDGGYILAQSSLTREVNMTYETSTPSTMNLTVYALNGEGEYESIGSEAETGTSGTITISVPVISGNTSFFASVYQDDVFKRSQWVDFEEDAGLYLGNALSLFLGALIILAFGLIAISEGVGVIVFLLLGMVIAMILGLVDYRTSSGINVLIYFIIAGGIILWKLTRRKLR